MRLRCVGGFVSLLVLLCSLSAQDRKENPQPQQVELTEDQIRELIRQAADKDIENISASGNTPMCSARTSTSWMGTERGKVHPITNARSHDHLWRARGALIAKDDKALSQKDAASLINAKNESEGEGSKRLEKEKKDQEEGRAFVREIADAYNFHFVGEEKLDAHDTYVIDAAPRPGYQPRLKDARFLPKFRFRAWVDKAEMQWVKLDIHCVDTVSIGLFLARIHKGSHFELEQTRINDEVWLPKHVLLNLDARIALLKGLNMSLEITFRDYKKFRADSKIMGVGRILE